jgi:hypothetical protein
MGIQPTVVNLAINLVNRLAFAPAKGLTSRCPAGHGKGKRQGYQTKFDYQGGIEYKSSMFCVYVLPLPLPAGYYKRSLLTLQLTLLIA